MTKYLPILQNYQMDDLYDLDRIVDENDVLTIDLIHPSESRLRVTWRYFLIYRRCDEGDALKTLSEIGHTAKLGLSFYEASDSEFLSWFLEQSGGKWVDHSLRHYLISTVNAIIEVISPELPEISIC